MIEKIVKNGFCMGCGLCQSVLGKDHCEMSLFDDGFYYPVLKREGRDKDVKLFCPGIRVIGAKHNKIWGRIEAIEEAWATDEELRFQAASGGVTSALAIYLLESGQVDAILQVGVKHDSATINELKISKTKKEVIDNAQSRYAPCLTLVHLKQILDNNSDVYAFIGKPCDIAGVRNFMKQYPQYSHRVKYTISIFCGGMPSYGATETVWKQSGRKDAPVSVKYRGNGWPGNFKAVWQDGGSYEMSYGDSWGKILGRKVAFRCKICPDGVGLLADIAVGDSWNTKDGYPDFKEDEGRNFCILRTARGRKIFNAAVKERYIDSRDLKEEKIKDMQPYQYARRIWAPWRVLAANMLSGGLLHFKGLGLLSGAFKGDKRSVLNEFHGAMRRMIDNKQRIKGIKPAEKNRKL